MKAAFIEETGPPEVIQWGDMDTPEPKGSEVLVKTQAVSVNPVDTYIRGGLIGFELPQRFIVGCDIAGTVEGVGPKVRTLRKGDRVWGSNQGLLGRQGTFAEYAAIGEEWLYPLPEGVEPKTAAAVALTGITAHLGLFLHGQARRGERLLVNGGTGGVGSMVVQMARAAGLKVLATSGSDAKREKSLELGAEVAVNYKTEDVDAAIRDFAPEGLDIWWETRLQPEMGRTIQSLGKRGRMILMAGRDAQPAFPVGPFYVKDLSLRGFAMFNASAEEQRECAEDINRWMSERKLEPIIGLETTLSDAARAHRMQEENTVGGAGTLTGKIILIP